MNSNHPPSSESRGMALPLATLGLCAWHALPPLAAAWGNDLYSRGAAAAFVIWLLSQCIVVFASQSPRRKSSNAWIVVSLILCVTGSMSGLRVIQHLALASAVTGVLGFGYAGVLSVAAAAIWMPASGWFLSHIRSGGLAGWERPAAAIAFALCFASLSRRSHPSAFKHPLSNP